MDCRVVLAQTEPLLGNLAQNLETHLAEIDAAVASKADLVLFPELSLTGYFLKDQTTDVALSLDAPELNALASRSRDISIAAGFVELGRDGRTYNSVAFFEDGEILEVHRKVHLVSYGMFDEGRDFACGERFGAFESKHGRFGLLICEDMWHIASSYLHFLANVDAILVVSAGPGRGVTEATPVLRSTRVWNTLQDALALLFQTWVVYVNRVGCEDGVLFAGGSRVVDPLGRVTANLEGLDAGRIEARLTSEALRHARTATPLRRDEKPWIVARELAKLQTLAQT